MQQGLFTFYNVTYFHCPGTLSHDNPRVSKHLETSCDTPQLVTLNEFLVMTKQQFFLESPCFVQTGTTSNTQDGQLLFILANHSRKENLSRTVWVCMVCDASSDSLCPCHGLCRVRVMVCVVSVLWPAMCPCYGLCRVRVMICHVSVL